MRARILNALLGVWLVASAYLWPHHRGEFLNAWITGVAMIVFAFIGMRRRGARWADAALALWLFSSMFIFPYAAGMSVLNHILVAMVVLVVSFFPLAAITEPTLAWSVPPTPDV